MGEKTEKKEPWKKETKRGKMIKSKKRNSHLHSNINYKLLKCKRSNSRPDIVNLKKRYSMSKRSQGHVEMIISFVIFISFIIFLIIVFKPARIAAADTSALDITESKILKYFSTNLTVSSITLNSSFSTAVGSCIYTEFPLSSSIIIKSEDTSIVNAKRENDNIYFEYNGQRFYRIYSSIELEEKNIDISSCQKLNGGNYTIGVTKVQEKTSFSKLIKFNYSYYNDYSNLKKNLSLINDFTFVIRDSSGNIFEGNRYKPSGLNIIAKDIPIEILDSNASLTQAILNLQVWD